MQILQAAGDLAGVRGQLWRVERIETHGARTSLAHLTRPGEAGARAMVAVRPADRLQPMAVRDALGAVAQARALERAAFAVPAAERLNGAVHPWQLAAALAFARGHSRVLVADPVGAGKTVSAAIAIAECLGGGHERRALVIAPGHLIGQWRAELARRVGVDARHADAAGLRQAQRELPAGAAPWMRTGCTLASIDFLKQPHIARSLEPVAWDLVVIDEAHTACGLSERHAVCDLVARRARRLLMLTATPSDGGTERRDALTSLGSAGEPLITLRHADADRPHTRERTLRMAPPADVEVLHRMLSDYTAWLSASPRASTPAVGLLAALLVKRALSSAHALRISLVRRLALLRAQPVDMQPSLFDVEDDPGVLGAVSGHPTARERQCVEQLIELAARAAQRDRRLERLEQLISRAREPVVIFSCFRDTAELLLQRLSTGRDCRVVHGQLPPAVADAAIAAFTEGSARVLIATDVAAQGLNLHQRCRWVVHYDLPWRPSTIRQRGGRVDRIGQSRRPHATMLVDATPLAQQMLERTAALTRRMRADERESAARWRVLAAREAARVRARADDQAGSPATPLLPGITHVVEIDLVDEAGATVERTLIAARGERADAISAASAIAGQRASALRRPLHARARRRAARERAVSAATLETIASTLVQGGLFDRRGVRQHDAREEARAIAACALDAATGHIDRAARIHSARLRVVAAFTKAGED